MLGWTTVFEEGLGPKHPLVEYDFVYTTDKAGIAEYRKQVQKISSILHAVWPGLRKPIFEAVFGLKPDLGCNVPHDTSKPGPYVEREACANNQFAIARRWQALTIPFLATVCG